MGHSIFRFGQWFLGAFVVSLLAMNTGCSSGGSDDVDGGTDGGNQPEGCADGPTYTQAEFIAASIEHLRTFYGTDEGFEGGDIIFQEIMQWPEDCAHEDSSIAYRVALPEPFRPRPQHTHVSMIWTLDGEPHIFVQGDLSVSPYVGGSTPLGAAITFTPEISNAEAQDIAEEFDEKYDPMLIEVLLGDPPEYEAGLSITFGWTRYALEDPSISATTIEMYDDIAEDDRISGVNLAHWAFSGDTQFAEAQTVTDDPIQIDCLRTFTAEKPIITHTSLWFPLGPGRHYNLEECPIDGWPPECEFYESEECQEAMED